MSDLTDRMRTCAAAMLTENFDAWREYENEQQARILRDAAALLLEAATLLDCVADRGEIIPIVNQPEPMEIIEPPPAGFDIDRKPTGTWVDSNSALPIANPYRSKRTCPNCDSRAQKIVRHYKNRLTLECPVCGQQWDYVR